MSLNNVSSISAVDVPSTTTSTSGDSGTLDADGYGCLSFTANITAISGTTPTIQFIVQTSRDGTNWSTSNSTPRLTSTGAFSLTGITIHSRYYRYQWIVLGTSPSVTFSITTNLKVFATERSIIVSNYTDLDLTVVGNVSTVFEAKGCSNISIMSVRASDGGNNGAFNVQASNDSVNWDLISGNITQGPGTTITTTYSNQAFRYYRLIVQAKTSLGTRVVDIHWGAT